MSSLKNPIGNANPTELTNGNANDRVDQSTWERQRESLEWPDPYSGALLSVELGGMMLSEHNNQWNKMALEVARKERERTMAYTKEFKEFARSVEDNGVEIVCPTLAEVHATLTAFARLVREEAEALYKAEPIPERIAQARAFNVICERFSLDRETK